jgi:hypothetical protein
MVDLRQRVELTLIPAGNDSTVLIEWQQRGTRFHEIKLPSSWTAARAWTEAHYECVEWASDLRGTGLIGGLADDNL